MATQKLELTLTGHRGNVNSVAISPDGLTLASGSSDDTIKVWDLATGKLESSFVAARSDSVNSLAISPDGKTIVSGSSDSTIKVWQALP